MFSKILIISFVINYDPPREFNNYLHRAGRTCRGLNTEGLCISLLIKFRDDKFAKFLDYNLKSRNKTVPENLRQVLNKKTKSKSKSKSSKILKKRNDQEMKKKEEYGNHHHININIKRIKLHK